MKLVVQLFTAKGNLY